MCKPKIKKMSDSFSWITNVCNVHIDASRPSFPIPTNGNGLMRHILESSNVRMMTSQMLIKVHTSMKPRRATTADHIILIVLETANGLLSEIKDNDLSRDDIFNVDAASVAWLVSSQPFNQNNYSTRNTIKIRFLISVKTSNHGIKSWFTTKIQTKL